MIYILLSTLLFLNTGYGQIVYGCPMFGCTPGGSFSLNPVIISSDVRIAWTANIENSSATLPSNTQLGCVSNENNIVCPTSNGYVSLDPATGKELWRTRVLLRPTLPIMDIYGNIIGCDGPTLVKIDSDGTVEPIIHLDLPIDSIYSLNLLTETNALLIVSENGIVVAYLTNGVPLASLQLKGSIDGQYGIFHPISAPVISGRRAYILTQFQGTQTSNMKFQPALRLFAVEIKDIIIDRIHIVWFVDVQDSPHGATPYKDFPGSTSEHVSTQWRLFAVDVIRRMVKKMYVGWHFDIHRDLQLEDDRRQASLLVTGDKILISLSTSNSTGSSVDENGILWSIEDTGNSARIVYQTTSGASKLALYNQNQNRLSFQPAIIKDSKNLLWATSLQGHEIFGLDWQTGSIVFKIIVEQLFGMNVSISTSVMLGVINNNAVLLFGLRNLVNATECWVTAVEVTTSDSNFTTTILWKQLVTLQSSNSSFLSGQLVSFSLNPQGNENVRVVSITNDGNTYSVICIE